MTDRLSTLMHDEVSHLDVPAPPAGAVLAQGRRLRRRRQVTTSLAAAAVVAVVAGTGVAASLVLGGPEADRTSDVSPAMTQYLQGGAFATGSEIHYGGDDRTVVLDEEVKVLYYTSAGVLVRSGDEPWTDSAGPSHYTLVTPEGDQRELDLDLGDRVPATDPDAPHLAWAEPAGQGAWDVVVRDVRTDEEISRTRVEGAFTWGGWEAPPVALADGVAYVGLDEETAAVDLESGEVGAADLLGRSTMPEVAGGRSVTYGKDRVQVVDLGTGEALLEVPADGFPYIDMSPDGRYAKVVLQERGPGGEEQGFEVHDLATGESARVDGPAWDFGWTPDGWLLKVDKDSVTTCAPLSGRCDSERIDLGRGELKLGGMAYES